MELITSTEAWSTLWVILGSYEGKNSGRTDLEVVGLSRGLWGLLSQCQGGAPYEEGEEGGQNFPDLLNKEQEG